MANTPDSRMIVLVSYSTLSKQASTAKDILTYLSSIRLLVRSTENRKMLDTLITMEELHQVTVAFPNCKAPGDDGRGIQNVLGTDLALPVKGVERCQTTGYFTFI